MIFPQPGLPGTSFDQILQGIPQVQQQSIFGPPQPQGGGIFGPPPQQQQRGGLGGLFDRINQAASTPLFNIGLDLLTNNGRNASQAGLRASQLQQQQRAQGQEDRAARRRAAAAAAQQGFNNNLATRADARAQGTFDRPQLRNVGVGSKVIDPTGQVVFENQIPGGATVTLPGGMTIQASDLTPTSNDGAPIDGAGLNSNNSLGTSLFDAIPQAVGVGNLAQAASAATLGQIPGLDQISAINDPSTNAARQDFRTSQNELIRSLALNQRFPIAEQNRLKELFINVDNPLASISATQDRVAALDLFLTDKIEDEASAALNKTLPKDVREDARAAIDAMTNFRRKLNIPREAMIDDILARNPNATNAEVKREVLRRRRFLEAQ